MTENLLHHRRLSAVEIADGTTLRKCFGDIQRQRFSIPARALADVDLFDVALGGAFDRNRQRWCTGSGVHFQRIHAIAEQSPLGSIPPTGLQREHLIEPNSGSGLPALAVKIQSERASTLRECFLAAEFSRPVGGKGREVIHRPACSASEGGEQ